MTFRFFVVALNQYNFLLLRLLHLGITYYNVYGFDTCINFNLALHINVECCLMFNFCVDTLSFHMHILCTVPFDLSKLTQP